MSGAPTSQPANSSQQELRPRGRPTDRPQAPAPPQRSSTRSSKSRTTSKAASKKKAAPTAQASQASEVSAPQHLENTLKGLAVTADFVTNEYQPLAASDFTPGAYENFAAYQSHADPSLLSMQLQQPPNRPNPFQPQPQEAPQQASHAHYTPTYALPQHPPLQQQWGQYPGPPSQQPWGEFQSQSSSSQQQQQAQWGTDEEEELQRGGEEGDEEEEELQWGGEEYPTLEQRSMELQWGQESVFQQQGPYTTLDDPMYPPGSMYPPDPMYTMTNPIAPMQYVPVLQQPHLPLSYPQSHLPSLYPQPHLPSLYTQPTAARSVPAVHQGISIDELRRRSEQELFTLSGPSQSVLGAHRRGRPPRLPQPQHLLNRPSSPSTSVISRVRSAMSESSSITSSSVTNHQGPSEAPQDLPPLRREASGHGIHRQIHRSTRRAGVKSKVQPLPIADKFNHIQAGIILIAHLCKENCWPLASVKRDEDLEEALLQANFMARNEGRPTTTGNKSMYNRIHAIASAWCGAFKVSAIKALHLYEIIPTLHQKKEHNMTKEDVLAFTQDQIIILCKKDAFCDDGFDAEGHPSLYSHPAFLEFLLDFFYGHNGIAVQHPEDFTTIFPVAENKSGEHLTEKLNKDRQLIYLKDLAVVNDLANPLVDAYHAPMMQDLRKSLVSRGRARLAAGSSFDADFYADIADNLSHIRHNIPISRSSSAPTPISGNEDDDDDLDAMGESDPDP
ncbi:hypothetical protein FIBSPDRAFT_945946 [Athelia psychrophila]|uniref:DUF6532 domain-containing protein n=1 Tax=Athelia psychrophila TaxID=1759441 RepID=A0A166TH64_9AGAM|nr:hypothetical protein FIBSPDRAFT_945946 [Fibularhizoctonia sp. CBS 109695]